MTPNDFCSELAFRSRHPVRWHLWHLLRGMVWGVLLGATLYLAALELAWAWMGR